MTAARLGIVTVLAVGALTTAQEAPKPADQTASTAAQKLEPFEVTGSRVKRLDYETPAPVITYSATTIDEKGYTMTDPGRVLIAGASYGGYATMDGLAFTPELYCAGINYVGVVDINELIPRGDSISAERMHWYSTRIGDLAKSEDRQRIHDTSPVHFAERIVAPVLMAYGRNDPRVRISQGLDMEAALKKAGKTYEMIVEEKEGHGFRKEELSIAFYTRVDAFLKKYVQKADVKIGPTKVIELPAKSGG